MGALRAKRLTRFLQAYDRELYAVHESDCTKIYRKSYRYNWFEVGDATLGYSQLYPRYICALTTTWSLNGTSVDWAFDSILSHIKSIDSHSDFNESKKVIDNLEKDYEVREKQVRGMHEDIAREARPMFKKAFADVNTASMEKIDKRRLRNVSNS